MSENGNLGREWAIEWEIEGNFPGFFKELGRELHKGRLELQSLARIRGRRRRPSTLLVLRPLLRFGSLNIATLDSTFELLVGLFLCPRGYFLSRHIGES
jgi:hypothetical protein